MITVTDTVKHPNGTPISGATFTLKQTIYVCGVPTSATHTVVANELGVYSVDLECGVYTLTIGLGLTRLQQGLGKITIDVGTPNPTSFQYLIGEQVPPPSPIIEQLRLLVQQAEDAEKGAKSSEVNAKDSENKSKVSEDNGLVSEQSALASANVATQKALEASNDADQATIDAKTASDAVVTIEPLVVTATDKAKESSDSADLANGYSDTAKSDSESATVSAATATEKAAEAKASADIASDSMNFKTETILIPKWESPDVNFVQATKTFVFKLQDVSIYKLTPAVWDMSTRDMVSFTRSTKAWWDGVEYEVGVPRIKDDKLLIEGQATNLCVVDDFKLDSFTVTSITNDTYAFTSYRGDVFSQGVYGLANQSFGMDDTSAYTISFIIESSVDVKKLAVGNCSWGYTAPGCLIDLQANVPFHFSYTGVFSKDITDGFRVTLFYSQDRILFPTGAIVKITKPQLEIGKITTSFIPTTTTAVTRAADIATVRDK